MLGRFRACWPDFDQISVPSRALERPNATANAVWLRTQVPLRHATAVLTEPRDLSDGGRIARETLRSLHAVRHAVAIVVVVVVGAASRLNV